MGLHCRFFWKKDKKTRRQAQEFNTPLSAKLFKKKTLDAVNFATNTFQHLLQHCDTVNSFSFSVYEYEVSYGKCLCQNRHFEWFSRERTRRFFSSRDILDLHGYDVALFEWLKHCKVTLRLVLFLVAHTSMRACCCPNMYALCLQHKFMTLLVCLGLWLFTAPAALWVLQRF